MSKLILAMLFGAIVMVGLSTPSVVGYAQQTDKSTQAGKSSEAATDEDRAEDADETGDNDVGDNPEGMAEGDDTDTDEPEKTKK
jgi:hypothetical protein